MQKLLRIMVYDLILSWNSDNFKKSFENKLQTMKRINCKVNPMELQFNCKRALKVGAVNCTT